MLLNFVQLALNMCFLPSSHRSVSLPFFPLPQTSVLVTAPDMDDDDGPLLSTIPSLSASFSPFLTGTSSSPSSPPLPPPSPHKHSPRQQPPLTGSGMSLPVPPYKQSRMGVSPPDISSLLQRHASPPLPATTPGGAALFGSPAILTGLPAPSRRPRPTPPEAPGIDTPPTAVATPPSPPVVPSSSSPCQQQACTSALVQSQPETPASLSTPVTSATTTEMAAGSMAPPTEGLTASAEETPSLAGPSSAKAPPSTGATTTTIDNTLAALSLGDSATCTRLLTVSCAFSQLAMYLQRTRRGMMN